MTISPGKGSCGAGYPERVPVQPRDLDEEELGERAAEWQLHEELGACYSDLKDRAWSVVLGCYAKCVTSLGPENVPLQWKPSLDSRGMWHLPGGEP